MYVDDVPSGTRVMSGRWVETMTSPTVWKAKWTVRGNEEPRSDEGCFAAMATIGGVRTVLSMCADVGDKRSLETTHNGGIAAKNSAIYDPWDPRRISFAT